MVKSVPFSNVVFLTVHMTCTCSKTNYCNLFNKKNYFPWTSASPHHVGTSCARDTLLSEFNMLKACYMTFDL